MDKTILDQVCNTVYKQYPIIKDRHPQVTKQGADRYLLVFSGSGKSPDGKSIQHTIRVVASEDGRIIKTSMSR